MGKEHHHSKGQRRVGGRFTAEQSNGLSGALQMGARHGGWCVGCCWALMASLFALGVMSVVWMALVAGLIAFEKLIPSRRVATYGQPLYSSFSGCSCLRLQM